MEIKIIYKVTGDGDQKQFNCRLYLKLDDTSCKHIGDIILNEDQFLSLHKRPLIRINDLIPYELFGTGAKRYGD